MENQTQFMNETETNDAFVINKEKYIPFLLLYVIFSIVGAKGTYDMIKRLNINNLKKHFDEIGNASVVGLILTNKALRTSSVFILICHGAFAELIISLATLPLCTFGENNNLSSFY